MKQVKRRSTKFRKLEARQASKHTTCGLLCIMLLTGDTYVMGLAVIVFSVIGIRLVTFEGSKPPLLEKRSALARSDGVSFGISTKTLDSSIVSKEYICRSSEMPLCVIRFRWSIPLVPSIGGCLLRCRCGLISLSFSEFLILRPSKAL